MSAYSGQTVEIRWNFSSDPAAEFEGLYLDDISFGRETLKRMISVLHEHRDEIIIDLHSAQGWQNPDWHCDNPADISLLWDSPYYRGRVADFYAAIARRGAKRLRRE